MMTDRARIYSSLGRYADIYGWAVFEIDAAWRSLGPSTMTASRAESIVADYDIRSESVAFAHDVCIYQPSVLSSCRLLPGDYF
jgi:hypothetical protein